MVSTIQFLSLVGFLLSCYAWHVTSQLQRSRRYTALCDVNKHISCSKAFSSKYGVTLGIANYVYGLVFYPLVFFFERGGYDGLVFLMAAAAVLGSAYLAHASYIKQKNFCLVCSAIYVVNIALFLVALR